MSRYDIRTEHILAFEDGRHFSLEIDAVVVEGYPPSGSGPLEACDPGVGHEVVRWTVKYNGRDITKGIDKGALVAPLEQTVIEAFEFAGAEPEREGE